MTSAQFTESISANLRYWRGRVEASEDPALHALLPEHLNIHRALAFGLELPPTWRQAAELLLALNYSIEHSGSWRNWQELLQKALSLCTEEDALLRLRLLDHSAQYYRHDRAWEASLAATQEQERLAARLGQPEMLAQALLNYSKLTWRQRDYEAAERYARQALIAFEEVRATERQMGGLATVLGLIDYGRGNYADAISYHAQAVACFRRTDFLVLLARSLVNLALALEAGNDMEPAMAAYLEAQSLLADTTYEMDKTRIELSLGSLLFNAGCYDEAEAAYLRAYSPHLRRSGLVYFQGLATNNLGNVYLAQGRLGEAEAILNESLSLWRTAHAELQLANTRGTLAKTFAAQGRTAEALTAYQEAIRGVEAFTDDGWARQLLAEFRAEEAELRGRQEERGQAV